MSVFYLQSFASRTGVGLACVHAMSVSMAAMAVFLLLNLAVEQEWPPSCTPCWYLSGFTSSSHSDVQAGGALSIDLDLRSNSLGLGVQRKPGRFNPSCQSSRTWKHLTMMMIALVSLIY
jgi:hypothetical protein